MRILVVDDNRDVFASLEKVLEDDRLSYAPDTRTALELLGGGEEWDVALLDVMLGSEDGIEALRTIRSQYPGVQCVMISGYSGVDKAVQAIKLGAYDFLEKPLTYQKVRVTLKNACEHKNYSRLMEREDERFRLIGASPAIRELGALIDKAAGSDYPVLICGESGSGKEHVAHLIHWKSRRSAEEMVKLNCAAIPDSLFESELFGHEKGAFTGAAGMRRGKMEIADRGTLFLDEIGEMPLSQQAKLLRALEDREITRVGGEKRIKVDFRPICATNRRLDAAVREGTFREDLYYRVGVIAIQVPPLRERKEDIPLLVRKFLNDAAADGGTVLKQADDKLMEAICAMPFKGNVRELKNLVQRLYVFSDSQTIGVDSLRFAQTAANPPEDGGIFGQTMEYSEAKALLERTYIETQLALHDGNISRTAIALNMLPNNLMRKMKILGIRQ